MYYGKYACWPVSPWLLSFMLHVEALTGSDAESGWRAAIIKHVWISQSRDLQPNIPSCVLMTVKRLRSVEVRFGFGDKWAV